MHDSTPAMAMKWRNKLDKTAEKDFQEMLDKASARSVLKHPHKLVLCSQVTEGCIPDRIQVVDARGYWLKCTQCHREITVQRRAAFLKGNCTPVKGLDLQEVTRELPEVEGRPPAMDETTIELDRRQVDAEGEEAILVCSSDEEDVMVADLLARGGLRVATLNVGALNNKLEDVLELDCDICMLQETAIPKAAQPVKTRCKGQGAMIEFSSERQQDVRQRSKRAPPGVRLGTGAAIVVKHGWKLLPLRTILPDTERKRSADHAIVSATAVLGELKIVVHCLPTGE